MMELLFGAFFLVLVLVWTTRMETGLNKLNETAARIEAQLTEKKKEKK